MGKLPTQSQLALEVKDALDQRVIKIAGYMDDIERILYSHPAPGPILVSPRRLTFLPNDEAQRLEQLNMLLNEERRLARILVWELMVDIGLGEEAVVLERYWREKKREVRS